MMTASFVYGQLQPPQYLPYYQTPDASDTVLRHRFGIAPTLTLGDKLAGNLMLSVVYAYRFSSLFEIEANVGMMSNPFVHNIAGLNPHDIEEFKRREKQVSIFSFIQTGSTLADIGGTITPFPAPWDCVHFTFGLAVQRWVGYVNLGYYQILTPPTIRTSFVDFQNYYFDIVRFLPFARFSNTIPITDRLQADVRFGLYASDKDFIGIGSGTMFIRLVNLGGVISYRL